MATTAADDFLSTLEKSNLLTDEQLADARAMAEESHDATAFARALIRQDLLTRWQAGQLLAGRSSFFLGKYKLIELLGRGGMGHVFLGEHTTMNRRVALKIVSREVRKDPASLARFLSEARAIAALDHPNIVRAYSVDNEGDRYYIVMEYVDGIDLQRMVEENGPLDYENAADCIRQAAEGLAHGHGRNMIHCDVKPSNLLVNDQGVVKIVDMGLSRLAETDRQQPNGQDDGVLGTVDYLAPEQALESPDFDHRADIYALGCTLYFLLTGHPPFPEGSLHERLVKHQTQQPQSILEQRPDAPGDLVDLCEKMMAKKAEDRPQSAEQISRTLAEWRPPARKPERRTPLKVAQSLEKPAAAAGLPSIDVSFSAKPDPARSVSAKKKDSAKTGGFLSTPRQKIVAGAVALLVAAVLAVATIPLLGGPSPKPHEADPIQVKPNDNEKIANDPDEDKTPKQPKDDNAFPAIGLLSDKPPAVEPPDVEPANQEPPDDEPASDGPPDDEPAKEETPAEGPPADESPAEEPQPKEPKKVDPFRELAEAVELQSLDTAAAAQAQPSEPLALGTLHLEPNASWNIELLGGSSALKGKRQFELKRDGDGKGWLVQIGSQTAAEPAAVARIWHNDEKLMFQWLKDAEPESANYLCNCVLNIHVGREKRPLRLSKPLQADPLEIDFIKRVVINKVRGRFLPEQSKLRLEITDLQGTFPAYRIEPRRPIATKERINVFLDGKDRHGNVQPMMCYQVEWAVKGDDLSVTLRLLQPNTRDFNFKLLENETGIAQARALSEQIEGQLKKESDGQKKVQMETALNRFAGLLWYAEQYKALHQKGRIHFRIYVESSEGEGSPKPQVELVNTQAGERQ